MPWNPIRKAHSTDAVTWRVRLDQPLLQRHQALIREKDARVRTVLPRTETAQQFVEIGPGGVTVHADGKAGGQNAPALLKYERFFSNGRPQLQLEVNGHDVTAVSHGQAEWRKTNGVVCRLFSDVGTALRQAEDIPIRQLELEYKDVFWWAGDWQDHALAELLQEHEMLVPAWVFNAGRLWHADNGKLVRADGSPHEAMVERMFLQGINGTVNGNPCPLLIAQTTLRWLDAEGGNPLPLKIQDAFATAMAVGAENRAQSRFDVMHERAVGMVRTILKPAMRERVGMA